MYAYMETVYHIVTFCLAHHVADEEEIANTCR